MTDAHVLVVDDDARLRALLSRYLAEQGFRVTTAGHAAEAREQMRFMQPDLLVLDVMMPGESGTFADRKACGASAPDFPILLLTARGAPEDQDRRIRGRCGRLSWASRSNPMNSCCGCAPCCAGSLRLLAEPVGTAARSARIDNSTSSGPRLSGPEGVVHLTGGEAALLQALARKPGEVLSRDWMVETLGYGRGRRARHRRARHPSAPQD